MACEMNKKTVRELRAIAKSNGLTRYSALRKADLIKLLVESAPPSSNSGGMRRKVRFVLPDGRGFDYSKALLPPVPPPPSSNGSTAGGTIPPQRPIPAPRTKKPVPPPPQKPVQRGKEIVSNFIQSGVELVESLPKKVPKAFNWVREKTSKVVGKMKSGKDLIADMINKNLTELAGNRKTKPNREVRLSDLVRDELDNQSRFKLVESRSSLRQFAKQYTIDVNQKGFTDLREFLSAVRPTIINHLREHRNIKAKLVVECVMTKTDIATGNEIVEIAFFHGFMEAIFEGTNIEEFYQRTVEKIMESLSRFQKEGSNWVIDSIEKVTLHTVKHNPLSGSSYIPLPAKIRNKNAIINMKNEDDECFKWCVTRHLNPVEKNAERITKLLRKQADELNWKGLKPPMELKDIHRFESLNKISVNVLGLDGTEVYPLRPSKADHSTEINLLLIHEEEKRHYCLIKDMSRLLSAQTTKNKRKEFYCMRCLNSFGRQDLLDNHKEFCGQYEGVKVIMPKEGSTVSFKNFHKKIDIPFVIYADFESLMKAFHSAQPDPNKAYTEKKMQHNPLSFCYYVKCSFDDSYSKVVTYTATSEDEDVSQIFVDMLEKEVKSIYVNHPPKKMIYTVREAKVFNEADHCWICGGGFEDKDVKVRDHCHYTGKFRGAAHNSCNLKARDPKFTPVIFHNLSGYDAHLFIKNLGVSQGKIKCIPNNKEKYISFTKDVEVQKYINKDGKEVSITRELRFIDSMKFMASSLANLVDNLGEDDFINTRKYYNHEQLKLLKRKGVYPYEWMDSLDKLNETELPQIDAFYSTLSGEGISDDDYEHAKKVWKTFDMKTFRDYHDLYNESDVLLLADVFEKFRKVCKTNYDLDPCWYYTAPGLAWDACLKLTEINLELLTDPDMLLMIERGLRGGISMVSTRHGKANNKYMGDKFDKSKQSKFITYLDANQLYPYAMSKKLPVGGFEWMDEQELTEGWKSRPQGCILEVDLEYPEDLHDLHNDYPLAPESLVINKVKKLIPNLNNKEKYVVHSENLKLYESLGLKITKIHRGIRFEESAWMKKYIDLNTRLRTKAKNDFEKDFFKLMNNSVFGKTMENLRKRVDIHLVNSDDRAAKLTSRPNFKHLTIFTDKLSAIEMKKTQIIYNKPVYLGMCILDLSKTLMYDFHYNYIKPKYNERAKLLFTDTDSLAYEIKTEDFYKDISPDVKSMFDTSNYPKDHPSCIETGVNKKVVGMFKDEAGGKIIEEFVGLRAKLYAYKMFEGDKKEEKKCKGVKKSVIANDIRFADYKKCLFDGTKEFRKMTVIRSRKHEVFTEEVNKVALSGDDDKRIILPNRVNTYAHGHYRTKKQELA